MSSILNPAVPAWLNLFRRAPVVDDTTRAWIRDVHAWAMAQQDDLRPLDQAHLVMPIREHFPAQVQSPHEAAVATFAAIRRHAGLEAVPMRLVPAGDGTRFPAIPSEAEPLVLEYDPLLWTNRQALVAQLARDLAGWWMYTRSRPAPAQEGNEAHVAELVAVWMGFGIFLANTAFISRVGGCGKCAGPAIDRSASLGRPEIAYALACFCRDRKIAPGEARSFLEPPLKGLFRQAMRLV
ncbi:hypothetical protein [Ectothiorhodospira shaposhnikovii]|uniref:hypothetical protein n=1 Tax=Ectothiorhodospira shaposhnikovii TaxID=1054 RepID=UPI0019058C92|nr:hypothetical protein [Ectothiorhodospira shaposhnikovii]MBK1671953.1 hypothetical protein [Ectothiorhodospira shaposhnikovii]